VSFEVICPFCGAPSGPSVGVCPFCKGVLPSGNSTTPDGKSSPEFEAVEKSYQAGKITEALSFATLAAGEGSLLKNVGFLVLYSKILLEAEGPISQIKGLLGKAHLLEPSNAEVNDYLDIAEAKSNYNEALLRAIVRRSPTNIHALFLLGSHLFWVDHENLQSAKLLEKSVQIRPNFLRGLGCLGAIYQKLGNHVLAARTFQKCATLETDPSMKSFFLEQAKSLA
jgi:tetratricopeptide (TPR) repeat protein